MSNTRHSARFSKLAATILATFASTMCGVVYCACAEPPTSNLAKVFARLEAKNEPKKAIGMLLSAAGSIQVPETTIVKIADKLYDVTFLIDKSALTSDTVATAIAYGESGEVYFASVTPPVLSDIHAALATIPECPAEDPTQIAMLNQLGPLQQLVDVRSERAKFARLRLDRILTNEMRARLKKAEQVFGLVAPQEFSSDLPAAELVDRLSRISFALKNYRTFKKPQPAAPAATQ
jgi:hypothetical protein